MEILLEWKTIKSRINMIVKMKFVLCGFMTVLLGCTFVSCNSEDVDSEMATSISYMLTISPDLLKFVSPEVTYVDADGIEHTISGVNELDSIETQIRLSMPGNVLVTKQQIVGTNYKCWNLAILFKTLPINTYMIVKYNKLDITEDTEGEIYDFHHSIFTTTMRATTNVKYDYKWYSSDPQVSFWTTGEVTNYIAFTKDGTCNGDDVENYITNLKDTPDFVGFYIDKDGGFSIRNTK